MPFMTQAGRISRETVPRARELRVPFSMEEKGISVHVLEHPPAEVGIVFKMKMKKKHGGWSKRPAFVNRYRIKVPWCYFLMRVNKAGAITDTFLFFAKERLVNLDGLVYLPPLPNIYPSAHICNGTIKVNFDDPLYVKLTEAFRSFWSTPFTEETWPEDHNLLPKCFQMMEKDCFFIEYGYLKHIFEYWQNHDACCDKDSPPCVFPWKPFRPRSKSGHYGGEIRALGEIMQYALKFNVKEHIPIE